MENNSYALGYRRLSSRDQSNYSLEYQEKAINDYCQRNNLHLLELFTDNGECSDTFDRADFIALEEYIKTQKGKARYLIIFAHDRFSRDLSEALAKIKSLEKKFGIKVLAVDEPLDLDIEDPDVFLQRAFKYLMANQELLRIRQRTRNGIRAATESGRFINKAPFGYRNVKDREGKGFIVVDSDEAEIVRLIFREFLMGNSVKGTEEIAKRKGFNKTGNGAITRVLEKCTYAGLVLVKADKHNAEKYVKGIHQPIISEVDFWTVQEKLGKRKPSKAQPKLDFPLRGVVNCWCGKKFTAGYSKGKRKYYMYYRCQEHSEKNYRGEIMHQQFEDILNSLSFSNDQISFLEDYCDTMLKDREMNDKKALLVRQENLSEIRTKIEKLEEKFVNDEIESSTYKKWLRKLMEEKAVLTQVIENTLKPGNHSEWTALKRLLPEITDLRSVYQRIDLRSKHILIKEVFKGNITYFDGAYRTSQVHSLFASNSLANNKKGLLEFEKPLSVSEIISFRSEDGS